MEMYEMDKHTEKRLQDMRERAGDKVIYNIDVISLVETIYTTNSEIYKAMTNGEQISGLVKKSIGKDKDSFTGAMKSRLYALCTKLEGVLNTEQGIQ